MTTPIHSGMPCDPIQLEEEPDPRDTDGHVTPVGGWIFLSLVILALLGLIAWAVTRG